VRRECFRLVTFLFGENIRIDQVNPEKTYFLFSYHEKKQPVYRKLTSGLLKKNIETLIRSSNDEPKNRVFSFGAGRTL